MTTEQITNACIGMFDVSERNYEALKMITTIFNIETKMEIILTTQWLPLFGCNQNGHTLV